MRRPLAEIVVISWNGRDDTIAALDSLSRQLTSETRVTVVDNGSSDGTAESVLGRFPSIRLLRLHRNRGFTGGIAAAADASDAKYLIFLNNDATVEPHWLEATIGAIESAPSDVVALSGKIVDPTGSRIDFVEGAMTFDGHAFQRGFRKSLGEIEEPQSGAELLFACGGNMIVNRESFLELGGFDPDYFAYLEDVDFGWRAWLSGWRVLYNPAAVVRHKSAATSDRLGSFERGVLFERNALQTAVKNYDDEVFSEVAGPLFLTLLHRLHRYVMDRNRDIDAFTRPALGEMPVAETANHESLSRRLRRKAARRLLGHHGGAVIDDPLTAMQFRAVEWFFRNESRIMEKRRGVQSRRRRSDREIFERFPIHYIPTYPGDETLMSSSLFRLLRPKLRSTDLKLEDMIQM
ncbi:MAG TPA: glycosyltransferase family 2 protein [Thermoanaerobaculia bacterium]